MSETIDRTFALSKWKDNRGPQTTTVRHDLWAAGFRSGIGVWGARQAPNTFHPFNSDAEGFYGEWITDDHAILDKQFDDGYGGEENPSVIFQDDAFTYLYDLYDGATSMFRVRRDISEYMKTGNKIPQPGGG